MIYFITYSNELYSKTRDFCAKKAKSRGKVDKVVVYRPEDIDSLFYSAHKDILDLKAGNGLWLWKPYFICKTLNEVADGDIVLYCDAGSFFFRNCKSIIDSMDGDVWVSNIPLIEKQFTKPELFSAMECQGEKFSETNQIQANFIAIRKTEYGVRFAKEWLSICSEGDNLSRNTIYEQEVPSFGFFGHRSDQSVLSVLAKKWGIKPHLDPSQYGRIPEKYFAPGRLYKRPDNFGEYKPCIILHRGKKPIFRTCVKQWLCTWLPLSLIYSFSEPCRQVGKQNNRP